LGFRQLRFCAEEARLASIHVEGFVDQFVLQSESPGEIVFVSESIENIPSRWRARETYRVVGPDEFVERFDIAEPGKDFEPYSETRFHRGK